MFFDVYNRIKRGELVFVISVNPRNFFEPLALRILQREEIMPKMMIFPRILFSFVICNLFSSKQDCTRIVHVECVKHSTCCSGKKENPVNPVIHLCLLLVCN